MTSSHAGHAHPSTKTARAACRRANGQHTPTGSTNRSRHTFTMLDRYQAPVILQVTSRSPQSISFVVTGHKASSITRPKHDAWFASTPLSAFGDDAVDPRD